MEVLVLAHSNSEISWFDLFLVSGNTALSVTPSGMSELDADKYVLGAAGPGLLLEQV